MILKKANPAELVAKNAEMNRMTEWYKNLLKIILLTFMEILPIGIVVSLVGSFVLKKQSIQ